jgi:preprotein translocase subunit SecA
MSRQRTVIYQERRRVLEGADLHEQVRGFLDDTVEGYVTGATEGFPEEWDLDKLFTALKTLYPVSVTKADVVDEADGVAAVTREELVEQLQADAQAAYDKREQDLGDEVMRELERRVVLSVLDRKWREHLYEMDYLREGIGLRAYSQRDPLVEYQREGYDLFTAMMESIKEESIGYLFNVEVQLTATEDEQDTARVQAAAAALVAGAPGEVPAEAPPAETQPTPDGHAHRPAIVAKGLSEPSAPRKLSYSAPTVDGDSAQPTVQEDAADEFAGVSRNELCPCGSGRKFKRCHGDPARRNA